VGKNEVIDLILGKVALAGGGGAADSRPLDEVFANWTGRRGNMLYLPIALRGMRPFETCYQWIRETFDPLGIECITMWTDLAEHATAELDQFASVYIGGGNTYALMAEFRASGFDRWLTDYVQRGGAVYGGSAGAAILGRDLRTVSHMDRNLVGLVEMSGLDLAGGHAVWCHYQPSDDALIADFLGQTGLPVLAISERSGITIEAEEMRRVGFEPAYRINQDGKTPL
jgi:dipeptidase E